MNHLDIPGNWICPYCEAEYDRDFTRCNCREGFFKRLEHVGLAHLIDELRLRGRMRA